MVLAEDSILLREGLVRLLADEGIETVAAVEDATGLLAALVEFEPDLAIVDVRMPPTFTDEGIRAALEARKRDPGVRILVLSQYVEERYAAELIGNDPSGIGYLLKERVADVADFVSAVRKVAAGGTAIDAEVVGQLLGRSRRQDPLATLTPRERDVLAAMASGASNAAIAGRLVITEGAMEKHIRNVLGKLGLEPSGHEHRRVLAVLRYLGY